MTEGLRHLLERIDRNVRALLSLFPVRLRIRFGHPHRRDNLPQGTFKMADITLTDVQHVSGSLEADDAAGNPVPFAFASPPTWTSSDPTIVTVSASADGQNADIATTGKLGTAQVTVTGTNAAGQPVTGIGNVTVVTSDATTFKLAFGTPSNK